MAKEENIFEQKHVPFSLRWIGPKCDCSENNDALL